MWTRLWPYAFVTFITIVLSEYLTKDERSLSLDVAKRLQVSHVILLGSDVAMMHQLSRDRLFGGYLSLKSILDEIDNLSQFRTLVVWKPNKSEMMELEALMLQRNPGICKPLWLLIPAKDALYSNMTSTYDCEVILADHINSPSKNRFRLSEVYSISDRRFVKEFGNWSESTGLVSSNLGFYYRRQNMEGAPFKVKIMALPPEFAKVYGKVFVPQQQAFHGLSVTFNFTLVPAKSDFVLDETPKPLFGSESHNMILTGVVRAFMYIKKPGYMRDSGHFLQPLEDEVWIAVFIIIVLGTIALFISHYFEEYSSEDENNKENVEILFTVLSLFCNQDGGKAPERDSSRFLHFVLRITALVVIPAYCAITTSFLTYRMIKTPFEDLKGLVDDGTYHVGAQAGTFSLTYFNLSTDKTVRSVGKNLLLPPIFSVPEGIKKLCNQKKFVFLDYNSWVEEESKPCALLKLPKPVLKIFIGVIFPDDFPVADALRSRHIVFFTSGQYNRYNKLNSESPVKNEEDDLFVPVDFELIQMALLMLLTFGVLFSVIIFNVEVMLSRHRQGKSSNQKKFPTKYRRWMDLDRYKERLVMDWN